MTKLVFYLDIGKATWTVYMNYFIALLGIILPSSAYSLNSIALLTSAEALTQKTITYSLPLKKEIDDTLDLGDSLSKGTLIFPSNGNKNYRATIQLETSMTVTAEGPHLDLSDWKHCTSEWLSLTEGKDGEYPLPDFDKINVDCFPQVSDEELKAEVLRVGGEHWVSILEGEGWPDGYRPVEVSLSTVRIKIEEKSGTSWQEVTVINMGIPMGC
jgi:hypothetical protein